MFNQKGCLKNKCLDAVVYLLNGAEFLRNWFPTLYLHLNDLSSLQTQSVKNAVIFFFFFFKVQLLSLVSVFLLMASAAFSQSPSLETLSHLLFAPPSISVSAIALTLVSSFPSPLPTLFFGTI